MSPAGGGDRPSGERPCFLVSGGARALRGEARVPGDKSIGHRAVLFAALADGRSRVSGLSGGEDNRRTVRAMALLGATVADDGEGALVIEGRGLRGLTAPDRPIDCGNSGTTMRLLAGVLAPRPFAATLFGDEYLERRPMGRVAGPLRRMGARVDGRAGQRPDDVYPPLTIGPAPRPLAPIDHASPIASAQVKSAVILAALLAEGRSRFVEPSRSRDHTERMLRAMGAPVFIDEDGAVIVDPRAWDGRLAPRELSVPGDFSSAAFLVGAALLSPGSDLLVRGVGLNPTRTGALDVMRAMGATIAIESPRDVGGEPVADLRVKATALRATAIAGELAVRAIDELPLLATLAAHAEGETTIADAAELRVKESDRIAATVASLRAFGADVEERDDGMIVRGRPGALHGARVDSHGDHRIAMAAAVCALAAAGETRVDDTANVATSYPRFVETLATLGAHLRAG